MPPRDKEKDRGTDPSRPKEKMRHKSTRSSRKEKSSTPPAHSTNTSPTPKRRASIPVSDSDRKATSNFPLNGKTNLPYPSFSKAHSKEAVGSRDNVVKQRLSYYTPDPTDLDQTKKPSEAAAMQDPIVMAPPTPPETTVDEKAKTEKPRIDTVRVERRRTDLQKAADDLKRRLGMDARIKSEVGKDRESHLSKPRTGHRASSGEEGKPPLSAKNSRSGTPSKPGTPSKLKPKPVTVEDAAPSSSFRKIPSFVQSAGAKSEKTANSNTDSEATSVARNQSTTQAPKDSRAAAAPDFDDDPPTPTVSEPQYPPSRKQTPAHLFNGTPSNAGVFNESPMPPPPPPPPDVVIPRVDYLMQNGGLPQSIPRSLLEIAQPPQQAISDGATQVDRFFTPFHNVLDDYSKVVSKSGSLAVATGYRSVARRLLDRLEAVFARDISSETCICTLCQASPGYGSDLDDKRGVSWGEILEYVCGRQELPQWPPFVIDNTGLGFFTSEQEAPMQKLDVDVPEDFRDHYIRQSKKTKQSVDKWLEAQPTKPISPPQDVDDETLTFAMLTRLEPEQRPVFKSFIGVEPSRPPSAAGERLMPPSSDLLQKTSLAIQRLYRLSPPPRDPESAMFLLTNPSLHNVLATLAAVSDGEWEILTSGRFDGFLRSGAEDAPTPPGPFPSQGPSRDRTSAYKMGTPSMPPSRGPTPYGRTPTPSHAAVGAPVALDEETEIAVLAEVEREIYHGMEALENAFEALHAKAEYVRGVLIERGAGLSQANQQRRGSCNLDARTGTPASHFGLESGTDDGFDDGISELAPDDSASNVSSSRHRRVKRRIERRTPAPVEEEDEESALGSRVGRRK